MRALLVLLAACAHDPPVNTTEDTGIRDADGDGFFTPEDCNDFDPTAYPGAVEICDGADNDCDGDWDEAGAEGGVTLYADVDGDGWGSTTATVQACEELSGYTGTTGDCDDYLDRVNPAAEEICDGIDNNCDGSTDQGDATGARAWYLDADDDGYGDAGVTTSACEAPDGYTDDASDCDDTDDDVSPAEREFCDGIDNNCDGNVDESSAVDASRFCGDHDRDGYGDDSVTTKACEAPSGYVTVGGDCDDADEDAYPGAPERCDGHDDDCDGDTDEEDAVDQETWYLDADHDRYGDFTSITEACDKPSGYVSNHGDCDDGDSAVNPGATETCNEVDDDCNGFVDDDASDADTWYADADGDGYGDAASAQVECDQPSGHVSQSGDCDDGDRTVHPGVAETWYDGADQDCDGGSDYDADGDGDDSDLHGGGDCDDADETIYEGAPEVCADGRDNDCNGVVDRCELLGDARAVLLGDAREDYAGWSVAARGDTNGDGRDDIVVGAIGADVGGTSAGAAYLVLGPVSGTHDLVERGSRLSGAGTNQWAGETVDLGDVDDDGFDDVLVGSREGTGDVARSGAAYVVLGPHTGNLSLALADATLKGETASQYLGSRVAVVGDVDGDGTNDVLLGGPNDDSTATNAGLAYLLSGPITASLSMGSATARLAGVASGDYAGETVAAAGDVNGDGLADLLVAATYAGSEAGEVYLLHGPVSGRVSLGAADVSFTGASAKDELGAGMCALGDTDGDGYGDFMVGAPGDDGGANAAGAAFLLRGAVSTSDVVEVLAAATILGNTASGALGTAVAGAGDMDGDGLGDVLVGAPLVGTVASKAGQAYLFTGALSGTVSLSSAAAWWEGAVATGYAGSALAGGGDVDGDGTPDLVVGAHADGTGGTSAGAVFLVPGGSW